MITVTDMRAVTPALYVKDLIDGRAYLDEANTLFVCNRVGGYVAFAMDGRYVINDQDTVSCFREVDLDIAIK